MLSYPSSRVDEYCCLGPPGRRGHTGGHRVEAYSNFPINGILMNLIMWIIEIWVFLRLQKLPNRASWAPVSFLKGTTWWIHFSKKNRSSTPIHAFSKFYWTTDWIRDISEYNLVLVDICLLNLIVYGRTGPWPPPPPPRPPILDSRALMNLIWCISRQGRVSCVRCALLSEVRILGLWAC